MTVDTSFDDVAQVDRRSSDDRRTSDDRRVTEAATDEERRQSPRRRGERRRQIDPTTCERDYTAEEIDFMKAIDRYRRENGRPFPTWSEVLEVLRALGYERVFEGDGHVVVKTSAQAQESDDTGSDSE